MVVIRDITGYRLDTELHQGATSCVYRGVRLHDGLPVVLKCLKNAFPTAQETARFEREFAVAGPLRLALSVRVLDLLERAHRAVLVYADDGCVSLDRFYAKRTLDAQTFLRVAIAATQALAEVHANKLIHFDVNPGNLLIDPQSGRIKLTDFELARSQYAEFEPGAVGKGTLRYMAPEQSGRTTLRADARADLYSLGASLFELASGRAVFGDLDDASLLHAHFALAPPLIRQFNDKFPPVLDAMVHKLLAKMPDDRYQSAQGLLDDLHQAQRKLRQNQGLDTLILGSSDQTLRLVNMHQMIGRDELLATLHAGCDIAMHSQQPLWIRLRGAAGSGKSTLAAHFAQSLSKSAVLLRGAGEAQAQTMPYAALISAFDCLLRHWLTANDNEIADICSDLRAAVGENLAVLEPLLPRLPSVVGALNTAQALGASAEQARFLTALRNFMHVAMARQHPLTFFIDDLQWVDPASLLLIEKLLQKELAPCLLITAERKDEASPILQEWIPRLQAAATHTQMHDLQPLSPGQLGELLDETLGCIEGGLTQRATLIDVLHSKTMGNPFFIRQLLGHLVRDGALSATRAAAGACWRFDAPRAQSLAIADNVLSLLGKRIGLLPLTQRLVLEHAACIGSRFDLATLSTVLPPAIAADLQQILHELSMLGLLQAITDGSFYQFIHERIREAALRLASQDELASIHLAIGRCWLGQTERSVFDTVSQLNLGMGLINNASEREALALLNARAARQARALTAYTASLEYAEHALELLPQAEAKPQPTIRCDLHALLADAQASAGHLETAITTFEHALDLARSDHARARILERYCDALQSSGRPAQALVQVQRALGMLGHELHLAAVDDVSSLASQQLEFERLFVRLADASVLDCLAQLDDADESAQRISRLYDKAVISAYFSRPDLLSFVTARSIEHVLKTGLTPASGLAFAWWSMILCIHDRHALATPFAQWARTIHDRFGNDYYGGAGRMVAAAMTLSWTRPYAEAYAEAGEGARLLNQSGNMQFASYGLIAQHIITVAQASDCEAMLASCEAWAAYCERHVPLELGQARIRRYCNERLLGRHPEPLDCEAIVQVYAAQNNATDVCESLTEMARFALLNDDFAQALTLCERVHPYFCAGAAGNLLLNFNHLVMLALSSARMACQADGQELAHLQAQFDYAAERIAHLSRLQKQNFAGYNDLIRAEGALMRGAHEAAYGAYLVAIKHAQQQGALLLQAQATQYLAQLLHSQDHQLANNVKQNADQLYRRAHCLIKLADQGNLNQTSEFSTDLNRRRVKLDDNLSRGVDVLSLMKANEAISSEVDYDRLLVRLLEIAVENAGAQRGVLVLQEDGEYGVVAATRDGRLHERLESTTRCPIQMIHYVARSGLVSVIENGQQRSAFREDQYFYANAVRSALATPVVRQGAVIGVLYLENNAVDGAFGNDRLEAIRLLLGAAAIALDNAALYSAQKLYADQLEERVKARTQELESANAALSRLANLDGLTQLANRRNFDLTCARFAQAHADVVLLICDVDDFKAYNDHYGHPAGDDVLRRIAATLASSTLPTTGLVARYGGEEFAIVLRDVDANEAERFAATVHQAIAALAIDHQYSRVAKHVTLSVGVARNPQLAANAIATLIADADKALYVAKLSGRNRVSVHADLHRSITPERKS